MVKYQDQWIIGYSGSSILCSSVFPEK